MKDLAVVLQIFIAISLIGAILLQTRRQGLSSSFGGGGEFYASKRGLEKLLFWATIIISGLFFLSSIINLIL